MSGNDDFGRIVRTHRTEIARGRTADDKADVIFEYFEFFYDTGERYFNLKGESDDHYVVTVPGIDMRHYSTMKGAERYFKRCLKSYIGIKIH